MSLIEFFAILTRSFSVRFLGTGFFGFVFRFLRAWIAITFRELILYDVENL